MRVVPAAIFAEGLRHLVGSIYGVNKKTGISNNAIHKWAVGADIPKLDTIARVFAAYPQWERELFALLRATIKAYVSQIEEDKSEAG